MHEDAERIRAAISYLDPNCDRELWFRYGCAIKNEMGNDGFDIWDEWSSGSKSYSASAAKSTWKSISAAGKVTIATLFRDAKIAHWPDDKKRTRPTAEQIAKRKADAAARDAAAEKEEAEARKVAADLAESVWEAATPCDTHPYLTKKKVPSHGLRTGRWAVVREETGEIVVLSENALLIPLMDRSRRIWSLQAILPKSAGRNKDYLKGGAKRGMFYPLGKAPLKTEDGSPVFLLGEGYATCASAHEATGHMTMVCFDVGGLRAVASQLRSRLPNAVIILLADNDTETFEKNGQNPGVETCDAVAREFDCLVATPPPGDFNDMHLAEGLEAVGARIDAAVAPEPVPVPEPEPEPEPSTQPSAPDYESFSAPAEAEDAMFSPPGDEAAPARAIAADNDGSRLDSIDPTGHFTVLGYDRGTFFVFVHEQSQISPFRSGELSDANLIMMAPLEWWEMNFPSSNGGMSRKLILNWFFRLAASRGIYDASRVRGRGAWDDAGRVVYHQGATLYVDGDVIPVTQIKSKFVYELANAQGVLEDDPLTDADGMALLAITKKFRWSKPGAAALLAGWTFLAPVCGALRWRPHIWVTGGAGSGKSTVLNGFVATCLGEPKVFANGNSSEAGIRQKLKADALPVLFDESEQNDEAEKRRMAPVLALIRQSSTQSEAQTFKGSISGESMNFHIRSMFCLASIQAGLENKADQDRLTKLSLLQVQTDGAGAATWAEIKEDLYKLSRDKTLAGRLLRRAINMLPIIQQNITVFVDAAAKKFGTQRMGDQYGTMLAGTWSLTRSVVATPEQAEKMIDGHDWSEFTEAGDVDDPEKALQTIMEAKVHSKGDTISIGSLVAVAAGGVVDGLALEMPTAARLLRDNGMDVSEGMLMFQNGSEALRRLVTGTKFESDLKALLARLPGAQKLKAHRYAPGVVQRGVGIPITLVTDNEPPL